MSQIEKQSRITNIIPYFPRESMHLPERDPNLQVLSYSESLEVLKEAPITPGQKEILQALLGRGGVKGFPGGLGIDYDFVFNFTQDTEKAIEEAITPFRGRVDAVLVPKHSAVIPGIQAAIAPGNVPVIKMEKNNYINDEQKFAFQVDSFTEGGRNILSVKRNVIQILKEEVGDQEARILFVDEMLDTGATAKGVGGEGGLIEQCNQVGLQVKLVGVVSLIAKSYTGVIKNLTEEFQIDIVSVIQLENLWLQSPQGAGIQIKGINYGLAFKNKTLNS